MSLEGGNPTGNVRVVISSNTHQQHALQVCGLRIERKYFIPEVGTAAAASASLSAAAALYRLSPAKGSRPGLPAGKQSWPLGWVGGSAKCHPVHPRPSCWTSQPPEN